MKSPVPQIPPGFLAAWQNETARDNQGRSKIFSVFTFVIALLLLLQHFIMPTIPVTNGFYNNYTIIFISLMVLTLVQFLLADRLYPRLSPPAQANFLLGWFSLVFGLGTWLTWTDLQLSPELTAWTLVILGSSILLRLPSIRFAVLFAVAYLVLMSGTLFTIKTSSQLNLSIMITVIPIIGLILNGSLERGRQEGFYYRNLMEQNNAELREMSFRDSLTQLFNRRYFDEYLGRAIASANRYHYPLSYVLLDIDHFKAVNDRYGHQTGDEVLSVFSRIMQDCVRESDLLARYGGEEFTLLLERTDLGDALIVAERIRQRIETSTAFPKGLRLTVSLGLTCLNNKDSPVSLLERCDKLLYKAKEAGRNRICLER